VRLGIRSRELPDGAGLEVVTVTDDSTAAKAGIQAGDIIKKWDKNPMTSRADLVGRLAELKPGDKVQVVIERDGATETKFLEMQSAE
jgi:S1-C subfamily serine protease